MVEIPIPLECNPVLQLFKEQNSQTEARFYIGDVSPEDLQGFDPVETTFNDHEKARVSESEFEETELYVGDLEDIGQFNFEETELTDSSVQAKGLHDGTVALDAILNEAMDDYETRLLTAASKGAV